MWRDVEAEVVVVAVDVVVDDEFESAFVALSGLRFLAFGSLSFASGDPAEGRTPRSSRARWDARSALLEMTSMAGLAFALRTVLSSLCASATT